MQASAFFSESGAELESDPCLVIDGDDEFFSSLLGAMRLPGLEKLQLFISDLHVLFESGGKFRSEIREGVFCITVDASAQRHLASTLEEFLHDPTFTQGRKLQETTVFHYIDVVEGFEVVVRRKAQRPTHIDDF